MPTFPPAPAQPPRQRAATARASRVPVRGSATTRSASAAARPRRRDQVRLGLVPAPTAVPSRPGSPGVQRPGGAGGPRPNPGMMPPRPNPGTGQAVGRPGLGPGGPRRRTRRPGHASRRPGRSPGSAGCGADPEVPAGGHTAAARVADLAERGRAASVPVQAVAVPVAVGVGAAPAQLARSAEPVGGRLGGRKSKKQRRQEFDNMSAPTIGGVQVPRGNGEVLRLPRGASLSDFAEKIDANPASLVTVMFHLGEMVTATQSVNEDTLQLLGAELNYTVQVVSPEDEDRELLESFDLDLRRGRGRRGRTWSPGRRS